MLRDMYDVWCNCSIRTGNLVFIEGIMDRLKYLNISRYNLPISIERLDIENEWVFQQHKYPKHTAVVVKHW